MQLAHGYKSSGISFLELLSLSATLQTQSKAFSAPDKC